MRDVYVIGAYTTAFKKHPGMSCGDLAREAYLGALADAGLKTGADSSRVGWAIAAGSSGARTRSAPRCCSTASTAFMGAWKDVLAGTHELSFCIGIEKLFSPEAPERTAASTARSTSPA